MSEASGRRPPSDAKNWLNSGRGQAPARRWTFGAEGPLVAMQLARETGELLAADQSGGLYLLNRRGKAEMVNHGFHDASDVAISDAGNLGVVVLGENVLVCVDRELEQLWTTQLPEPVLAVAIAPHGNYVAASLADGMNLIWDSSKKRICAFRAMRPLKHLRFCISRPWLFAAAEHGMLGAFEITGQAAWTEKLWSNVGDLAITADGNTLYVAGYTYGIQVFKKAGAIAGTYLIEGAPKLVASSIEPYRLLATTLEGQIYWLDANGEMLWGADLPEEAVRICCDPTGNWGICGFQSGRIVAFEWGDGLYS